VCAKNVQMLQGISCVFLSWEGLVKEDCVRFSVSTGSRGYDGQQMTMHLERENSMPW
jgi:hypothetical protein